MTLRRRALAFLVPTIALAVALLVWLTHSAVRETLLASLESRATARAGALAVEAAEALRARREAELLPSLHRAREVLGAESACAFAPDGTVIAHTNVLEAGKRAADADARRALSARAPLVLRTADRVIVFAPAWTGPPAAAADAFVLAGSRPAPGGEFVGAVRLEVPLSGALATAAALSRRLAAIAAAVGMLLIAAVLGLLWRILLPLGRLAQAVERIAEGRYDADLPAGAADEIGDLARRFNRMSLALATTTVHRDYLDSILNNMNDGLFIADAESGALRAANPAMERLAGEPAAALLGRPLARLLGPGPGTPARWLENWRTERRLKPIELTLSVQNGSRLPVLVTGGWLDASAGRPASLVGIAVDLTDRKLSAERIRRLNSRLASHLLELQRSNTDLERYAYAASHDLQEPLRKILMFADLVQEEAPGELSASARRHLARIRDAADRMKDLIEKLLEYSRARVHPDSFAPVDLRTEARCALSDLEQSVRETGARVEIGALPWLEADRVQIRMLLQNLIGNALKYCDGPPEVKVSASRSGEEWVVAVEDNGIGVPPAHSERIFQLFQRLHAKGSRGGSGVGLAVCKRIVEQHGGRIWVEPRAPAGSRFCFSLPARQQRAAPPPDEAEPEA